MILLVLVVIKRLIMKHQSYSKDYEPEVTLFIPAYNEIECIEQKINNSFQLDYPPDKIRFLWVTDGSNDGSAEFLQQYKVHWENRYRAVPGKQRGQPPDS